MTSNSFYQEVMPPLQLPRLDLKSQAHRIKFGQKWYRLEGLPEDMRCCNISMYSKYKFSSTFLLGFQSSKGIFSKCLLFLFTPNSRINAQYLKPSRGLSITEKK
jgi:hypothetical protein